MKIAIPTNDYIWISTSALDAKFFKVITFSGETIVSEAFRKKEKHAINKDWSLINDCDCILIHTEDDIKEIPQLESIQVSEKMITQIELDFIHQNVLSISNYTCAP